MDKGNNVDDSSSCAKNKQKNIEKHGNSTTMSKYFVPGVAPLREAFQLASLIPHLKQAEQDGFPTPRHKAGEDYPELTEPLDYRVQTQVNLGKLLEESNDNSFKAKVTKILSTSFGKSSSNTNWLGPCEVRKYTLINPQLLFKDLIKRDSVREWLKDAIEDGATKVYFVVGYYTVLDATTLDSTQQSSEYQVKSDVPVGDLVTQGATALIPGILDLDVGGSVNHTVGHTMSRASYLQGERVYAFCYRKVKFSIFPLGSRAASAKLKQDNCWSLTADNRGEDDREDDEGLQVDLEDNKEAGQDIFEVAGEDDSDRDEEE